MNTETVQTESKPQAQPIKLTIAVILLCLAGTAFYLGNAYREDIANLFSDEKINTTKLYDPDSDLAVMITRKEKKGQQPPLADFSIQLIKGNKTLNAGGLLFSAPANQQAEWMAVWRSPEVVLYLNDEPFVDGIAEQERQIWIKTYGMPEGFDDAQPSEE